MRAATAPPHRPASMTDTQPGHTLASLISRHAIGHLEQVTQAMHGSQLGAGITQQTDFQTAHAHCQFFPQIVRRAHPRRRARAIRFAAHHPTETTMSKRALILIDIQNDYLADGKWPLAEDAHCRRQCRAGTGCRVRSR